MNRAFFDDIKTLSLFINTIPKITNSRTINTNMQTDITKNLITWSTSGTGIVYYLTINYVYFAIKNGKTVLITRINKENNNSARASIPTKNYTVGNRWLSCKPQLNKRVSLYYE